jgi:hypothetical protein
METSFAFRLRCRIFGGKQTVNLLVEHEMSSTGRYNLDQRNDVSVKMVVEWRSKLNDRPRLNNDR